MTIAWQDPTITGVQITGDSSFANFVNFKTVAAGVTSTTAPSGFSFFGSSLILNPNITYYVRVYNGAVSTSVPFTIPVCGTTTVTVPTCISPSYGGTGVSMSWQDAGVNNLQISGDSTFTNFAFTKGVSPGTLTTTGPNGFGFFGSPLTLNPNTTYYVRTLRGATPGTVASFTVPSCNSPPAAPTVTLPACIASNYSGAGITISWLDTTVTSAQIAGDTSFANFVNFKAVSSATSTTAPAGFSFFGTALSLDPNVTYYVRVYNGATSPAVSFNIPGCGTTTIAALPACIPSNYSDTGSVHCLDRPFGAKRADRQ